MWCTAERRFVWHACLRNPCLLWNLSLHSLPEAWGPWERQHAPPAHYGCIMLAKDRVVVVVSKSKLWITGYGLWSCDCCKSMKNFRESAFSSVVWKRGCQTFSRLVVNCDVRVTCLRHPLPRFLFGIRSIQSLRKAWGSWEPQYVLPSLHWIMVASCQSLHCSCRKETSLMQRSRGFGHGVGAPRFVTILWLCSHLWHVTAANQWTIMNNWRDWAFRNSALEVGLPAFSHVRQMWRSEVDLCLM